MGLARKLLCLVAVAFAVACFLLPSTWRPGTDLTWRLNEAACLRTGVDPFEVCFGLREDATFCSVFRPEPGKRPVNAYTPWQYAWVMPFSFLPPRLAHALLAFGGALALVLCAGFVRRRALAAGLPRRDALCAAAATCALGLSLVRVLQVSNYGLLMAGALAILLDADLRGRTIPAGLALAVLAVKPQIALPLAVPLLLRGRWRVLALAGAVCFLSALLPSILCGTDVFTMTLRVFHSGTHSIRSTNIPGSPLAPPTILAHLPTGVPWMAAAAIAALALCVAGSIRMRKAPFGLHLLPAVACGLLWLPCHFHDRVLLAPILGLLVAAAATAPRDAAVFHRRAWVLFGAEFWLWVPIVAVLVAVRGISDLQALVAHPTARTAYDLFLFVLGWAQLLFLPRFPRTSPVYENA